MQIDFSKSYGYNKAATVLEFERAYTEQLLQRAGGNVSAASRDAKMDRKHLFDLARKHRIDLARLRSASNG